MAEIKATSDVTGGIEPIYGSDNRFNVSSRSDSRRYYNSRDKKLAFATVFEMTNPATGEYVAYWRNASKDKTLVISAIGFNCLLAARVKLNYVTGTATGGNELTPVNMNRADGGGAAPDDSVVMAMEGGSAASGIGGLTADGTIDFASAGAAGHEEFRLGDTLRLGLNDAIGIEVDEIASTGDVWGVMFGFYE